MPLANDRRISAKDALAYLSIKAHRMEEICSFDKHFDQLEDVVKLPNTS